MVFCLDYIYYALGTKLKKTVTDGGSVTSTDYTGNHVYQSGNLQFFNHAEGYVTPGGGSGYDYIYQYQDHLGNVRLSYMDNNGTTEIVEENNYYPFGLKHKGYNESVSPLGNSVANKWKYNNVELEEGLGLDLYEMPLRQYDPAIARWTSIDPVTHHSMSTYTAFDNNPIFWADPSGADGWNFNTTVGGDGLTNQQWLDLTRPSFGKTRSWGDQSAVARQNFQDEVAQSRRGSVFGGEGEFFNSEISEPDQIDIYRDSAGDIAANIILWAIKILNGEKVRLGDIIFHDRPKNLADRAADMLGGNGTSDAVASSPSIYLHSVNDAITVNYLPSEVASNKLIDHISFEYFKNGSQISFFSPYERNIYNHDVNSRILWVRQQRVVRNRSFTGIGFYSIIGNTINSHKNNGLSWGREWHPEIIRQWATFH